MKKNLVVTALIILLSCVFSCAPALVNIQKPSEIPSSCILGNVNQLYQGMNECGPTTLAMVLNYYGIKKSKDELKEDLRWHPEWGVSIQKMLGFPFNKLGLKDKVVWRGSIEEITQNISQNRPVIVRQWGSERARLEGKMGHWLVAVGYDYAKRMIYLRDPQQGFRAVGYEDFLSLWDMSHHKSPSKNFMFVLIQENTK
ncbi:MAG: C39 family peptidase [Nanoarchaeota archaeon]|nr:C39 family peptidase [Nanoarchaeota archaeon]